MRKSIALVIAATLVVVSVPFNGPARAASMVEYALLMFAVLVANTKKSDLPQPEKERVLQTIETWKTMPATEKNIAYVKKNSAELTKLLANPNNPTSRAALNKFMSSPSSGLGAGRTRRQKFACAERTGHLVSGAAVIGDFLRQQTERVRHVAALSILPYHFTGAVQ
jgi:hypothetical protein